MRTDSLSHQETDLISHDPQFIDDNYHRFLLRLCMLPKYPKAGGELTFTKNCFGKNMAFICGGFFVVAYLTNVLMNNAAFGLIVDGLDGSVDILKVYNCNSQEE